MGGGDYGDGDHMGGGFDNTHSSPGAGGSPSAGGKASSYVRFAAFALRANCVLIDCASQPAREQQSMMPVTIKQLNDLDSKAEKPKLDGKELVNVC